MGEKAEGGRSDATSQMILMPDRVLGTPRDGDHMETTRPFPTSLLVLPSPPSPAPLFPKACKLHPVQGETGAGRPGGGGGWVISIGGRGWVRCRSTSVQLLLKPFPFWS